LLNRPAPPYRPVSNVSAPRFRPMCRFYREDADMTGANTTLAEDLPWPPDVNDFFPPGVGGQPWISKIAVLLWIATAAVIVFFLVAYRRPKLTPTRTQWIAESICSASFRSPRYHRTRISHSRHSWP
jgi:hypothetical protein